MRSFELLSELEKEYNEQGYNSHNDIDMLKEKGILDKDIENTSIPKLLRTEISEFIDVLLNVNPFIQRQKLILEDMYKNDISYNAEYMLCHYLNDIDAYRNNPRELYKIIHKVNIDQFKYLNIEDIKSQFYRYLDVNEGFDSRREHYICEIMHKYSPKTELYNKYDSLFNPKQVNNVNNRNMFYIWAERNAYDYELDITKESNIKDRVLWVSRYYGDGYGFDILSINLDTNREKLIEVKSGKYKECSLTKTEAKVMRNSKYKNCDYYVYRYYYKENRNSTNIIRRIIYKYIPELDMMVDEDDNLYSINEYMGLNDEGELVKLFGIVANEKKYVKEENKTLTLKNTN